LEELAMREEKKYLVAEAAEYIGKSNYVFLAGFDRLSVADVAVLRKRLREKGAEYHVVKNSLLRLAMLEKNLPEFAAEALSGATAIVVGGDDPSAVAKVLHEFANDKEHEDKLSMKSGALDGRLLSAEDMVELSKLPTLSELRARLLSVLEAAARNFLFVCNAVPQGFLRVLAAHAEKSQ
jgi:large subunit ribosomal protein L10